MLLYFILGKVNLKKFYSIATSSYYIDGGQLRSSRMGKGKHNNKMDYT